MFAPPVLAVFNMLTFTVLPVTGALKVVLCLVFYIGAGMAYTAICITYGGLVNLIARDSQVRMNYTSARAIGSPISYFFFDTPFIFSWASLPTVCFFYLN